MLKCVPLNTAWTGSETKLDLKAIYRRRKQDNWGKPILDKNKMEQWDTTGPLPLRRHHQWVNKGFVYVTLADYDSLEKIAPELEAQGLPWREFIQDRRTRSPFSAELYQAGLKEELKTELADIKALIEEHGPEAVAAIMQRERPGWKIPAALEDVKQKKKRETSNA